MIFLFLAVLGKWPNGFYTLLRFAVCGSAVYLAWSAAMLNKRTWAWLMGAGAVLFNPFVQVRFDRPTWQAIDFIAALVFAASLIFVRNSRKRQSS
jgi:ABC-type Mn2+/Zn2+ transport system permease subunit